MQDDGAFRFEAPDVHPVHADQILALAQQHVGPFPVSARVVGYTDQRSSQNWSLTGTVLAGPLCIVAELRCRGGVELPPVVQVFRRSHIIQVVSSPDAAYAIVDMAPVDMSETGFKVEGPAISLPPGTPAWMLLDD